MRIAVLLTLVILLPAFAHADNSPTLTTYTVSQSTIYPNATADSGLATTTAIDTAFSEHVKVSIKITSASGATIKSLYSSSGVTNPAPKVWNGTNTAGTPVDNGTYTVLISATSTAASLTMTDSSKTIVVASSGDSDSSESNPDTPATATPAGGAPPEYIPIPTLRIITSGNRTVSSGVDTAFTAVVYDGKGNKRNEAIVSWSFGDGMQRTGANVYHAYYYSGEYIAVVHATTADGGDASVVNIITVKDASIKISSISTRGISLTNNSSRTLDLSSWRLSMGGKEFKIPSDTQILTGRTILFPSQIIQLPISTAASLLYPSGEVAATYPEVVAMTPSVSSGPALLADKQPFAAQTSFNIVQKVEPAPSTNVSGTAHEITAVNAPREMTAPPVSRGAVLTPPPTEKTAAVANSPTPGLFRSPWTLGLLGVIAIAGGAFILL